MPSTSGGGTGGIGLHSPGSTGLFLSHAGSTDGLHLGRGEARDVLVHMQSVAHSMAAIAGGSVGLAKHGGGLRQDSTQRSQENVQPVSCRRSVSRSSEDG